MKHFSIPIAGTTQHTVMCAEALLKDQRFTIPWILTPEPKIIGRKKELTKNPLHLFAEKHHIPVILIKKKIDNEIKLEIKCQTSNVSYLLVVDFGYIIPNWLLELPTIAPVNIHPSELPKYRGSSPGQFTLLFGEKTSAVSVIKMNNSVDQGDVIYQEKFKVLNTWTNTEYYRFAFQLIAEKLPNILAQQPLSFTPQPIESPTPMARRLTKDDGCISWEFLQKIMDGKKENKEGREVSPLLRQAFAHHQNWPKTINLAIKAFSPWPGLWTIVPTRKGEKRMKILSVETRFIASEQRIVLQDVQLEGLQPTSWNEIKNQIGETDK